MTQTTPRWDVFLSYSRKDAQDAQPVLDALHNAGCSVWFDLEERPAAPTALPLTMTYGLLESSVLCLLLSWNAITSSWVRLEFQTFLKRFSSYWDSVGHGPVVLIVPIEEREFNLEFLKVPHTPEGHDLPLENMTPEFLAQLVEPQNFLEQRPLSTLRLDPVVGPAAPARVAKEVREIVEQCVTQAADQPTESRAETASRYWDGTQPNVLAHWDAAKIPLTLGEFDRLTPPYDRWSGLPEGALKTELETLIDEVIDSGSTGLNYASLFAEAVGAAISPQFASIDDHTDPVQEIVFPGGPPSAVQVRSTGSPVDLLVNVAIDYGLIEPLQHAYYRARHVGLDQPTRDALDQTVMMAMGFAIHRWRNARVDIEDVTRRLVEQIETV